MDRCGLRFALLGALCLGLLAPGVVRAQTDLQDLLGGKKSLRAKTPKAEFTATVTPEAVRPGDTVTVSITAKLPDGYYIYGTDGTFAGKTRITLTSPQAEPIDAEFIPDHAGKTGVDPNLDNVEVTKFPGGVTWSRKYSVSAAATGEEVRFTGQLEGQYCSTGPSGQCIPIIPAHKFNIVAQLASVPAPAASTAALFETELRPTRKTGGEPQPDPIAFRFRLSPNDALSGGIVTLSVTATLDDGWHTYSLSQTGLGAAPTEIDLTPRNLEPIGEGFEADKPYVIEKSGDITLEAHYKTVTWSRQFRMSGDRRGDYGMVGDVSYVVCQENVCKPLNVVTFTVGVPGAPSAVAANEPEATPSPFGAVEEPVEPAPEIAAAPLDLPVPAVAKPQDKGLLSFLLLCLGGGFLALLTPCSFPMVPITVGFFLKQSEQEHKRPWVLALVYSASIVLAFTILGVGITLIFGAAQISDLATNGYLNIIMGAVFVAFGMSMLGAFELRIPGWLLTWSAAHESSAHSSYVGAIFMALTFTLTSFTCTFPVAGALLGQASQGEVYWPTIGMAAFGTAFAAPFFVLALVPGLMKKLPKSGGWMNTIKVVLGLIEIGAAMKFFSNADFAWNPTPWLFDYVTVMLIWTILSASIGAYLLGWFRFAHDTPVAGVSATRGLIAMSFFGVAGMLCYLIFEPDRASGVIMDQIVAFAPPRFEEPSPAPQPHGPTVVGEDLGPITEHYGLRFALDLQRAIPVARQSRKPLFLDFTGVYCINCRRMEKRMAESENRERLERFVAVQLYTDKVPVLTDEAQTERMLADNRKLQLDWFNSNALPMYAVVTPDGKQVLASFSGYTPGPEFTQFLDDGWMQWQQRQAKTAAIANPQQR